MDQIDLRSDTVTKPTPAMRRAMAEAEVGDDVLGDDPTVNQLQARVATLLGKDAACFVPSGSMANGSAIRAHTEPGDEIIAHEQSHFFMYETASFAAIAGCSFRPVGGERGLFGPAAIDEAMRPDKPHFARSRLVIVENTHNGGGGSVWPMDRIERVCTRAREHHLRLHMDGARLWNACAATGHEPSDYAAHFDTVSVCFSKGLGAPVGSAVAGDAGTIERVFRFRKMFGGAMRQSGILAAAALHALEHHLDRLAEDHANARRLAEGIDAIDGLTVDLAGVETNMVYFDVDDRLGSAGTLCRSLESHGVRMLPVGPSRVRAVCHLDVTSEQIERAIGIIGETTTA